MELVYDNGYYQNKLKQRVQLESEPIYGLIKSSDLKTPVVTNHRKYMIITQKKIGEDTAYLAQKYPQIYRYLTEHHHHFDRRQSAAYKNQPPFALFGIGDYAFKPYKVAISGLYKRSLFSLIIPENGKPLMLDDTCYFIGFDDLSTAVMVWAILNGEKVQQFLSSIVFLDAKRPYTKEILMRVDIKNAIKDVGYDEIYQQIQQLDHTMTNHISERKWKDFKKIFELSEIELNIFS